MWSSILTGSIWTFILSMFFLLSPTIKNIFRVSENNSYLLTGYFTFFIFIAVFNAFNARTEKLNLFDSIGRNKGFVQVIILIVFVQILMTYFGGVILRSYGLNLKEWIVVIGMAITIIPIDLIRKTFLKK